MAIIRTRDKVADDLDNTTIIGELYPDGEVRDDKGNVIEPYRGFVNGKAVRLYFTPENKAKVSLADLERIAEDADEDEEYLNEILHTAEKRAKKAGGDSGGRRKYGTGPARNDTKHIREWLRKQGVEISDRGRIPTDLMNRYNDRSTKPAAAPAPAFSNSDTASAKKRPTGPELLASYNNRHGKTLKKLTEAQETKEYEDYMAAAS